MKITDLTVTRYSELRQAQVSAEIQIVDVHTDGGVTGRGFMSTSSAVGDVMALLLRRNLKHVLVGENPLLTDDLWRRMYEQALPRRGGQGLVLTCIAAIDFALWDIKGKLLNVPVSALFGGQRERAATYANCAPHLPVGFAGGPHPYGRRPPQCQMDRVFYGRQPSDGVPESALQRPSPPEGADRGWYIPPPARGSWSRPGTRRGRRAGVPGAGVRPLARFARRLHATP